MNTRAVLLLCTLFASVTQVQAQLTINGGSSGTLSFGTIGFGEASFNLTPAGGTGPYVFDLPGAIAGFRVANRPDVPNGLSASITAVLIGMARTPGVNNGTIRVTDTATSATLSRPVTFTVSDVDVFGVFPGNYGVGDTVSFPLVGIGGTPPYTFSLFSGTLPPGTVLDGVGGAVSGTLTTAQAFTGFTIRVTDSASKTFNRGFGMAVNPVRLLPAPGTPNPRLLPTATINLVYSYQIGVSTSNLPCVCTFALVPGDSTPPGLTMSASGLISGTPTNSNTFGTSFTVTITDAALNSVQHRFALFVLPQTPQPLFINTFNPRDFTTGTDNETNEIFAAGGVPPFTFSVPPGSLPAGMILRQGFTLDPTLDPQSGLLRARALTPGSFNVPVTVQDSVGNVATRQIGFKITPIAFHYIFLPAGGGPTAVFGTPYQEELVPYGGTPPYTVTASSLAGGLSVNNQGIVTGTPAEIGRFLGLGLNLSDSGGNSYFSGGNITINAPPAVTNTLVLNGGDQGIIPKGNALGRNVSVTGSLLANPAWAVNLVSGALPPGLKLLTGKDFSNGGAVTNAAQIAGIPTAAGSYSFTISASDGAGGFGQREYLLRVSGLLITTVTMNSGTVGQSFTQTLDRQGGVAPFTFSLTTGSLPPGLNINPATGTISGMPTSTFATTVGVQVVDSLGDTFVRFFTLNIYSLQITTGFVLPTAVSGRPYTAPIVISPLGSYTWTATGLPAGLSINASTGVISGTVPAGNQSISAVNVTAANAATAVVKNFTLFTVALSGSTVLTGFPTASLGEIPTGQLLNTLLNVNGGTPPYTATLEPGSTLPPGVLLVPGNQFNGSQFFGRFALDGAATTAGTYNFKLRFTDSAGVFAVHLYTLGVRNIGLAQGTLGIGLVNQPYSAQMMPVGSAGPFTFVPSPLAGNVLPPGIGLSASGLLSGTPTSTGSFGFTVDFADGVNTRRQGVNVTIQATGNERIDFGLGPILTENPTGLNFSPVLTPTGGAGTHTWSIVGGALPPGMQLLSGATLPSDVSPPSAILAGALTTAGDYNFRIRVDDSAGNFGIRDAFVHVTPDRQGPSSPLTARTFTPPMRVGTPYTFAFTLINGRAPATYLDQPGTFLPTGVTMNSNGAFSGTPQESGNFVQFLRVTDADGFTRSAGFGLTGYPAGGPVGVLGAASPNLGDATAGIPFSYNLDDLLLPGFGIGPFNWAVDSGTLPTGLSLAGHIISGTPGSPGSSTFGIVATDTQGTQHLASLTLNVSNFSMSPLPGALPGGVAGSPYAPVNFSAAGGPGPFTYRVAWFSDFPAGLTLSPAGVLSGTPVTQGPFVVWIEGLDPSLNRIRQRYTLTIGPPGAPIPAITAAPTNITVGYTIGNPGPAPVPINIGSTAAAFSFTAVASGGPFLNVTPGSGNTSTAATVNANFSVVGLLAGTYNGAIAITAGSTSNSPLVIPVTLNVAAAPVCNYSLVPNAATILSGGGNLSFGVNAGIGCNWSASTSDPWVTVNTPSGTGTGSVSLGIAVNPNPAQRTGTVMVQGLPYSVTQFGSTCSFTISPPSLTVSAAVALGNVVTVNASAPGCAWTASGAAFATVSGAATGTGSGAVTIDVAANVGASSRSTTPTIAGQPLGVSQAGIGCTFALSASGASIPSTGGSTSVNMIAATGCAWSTDPGPSWVSVTGGTGSGFGTVNLTINPNSTVAIRTANVLIGGQSFLVSQAGASCSFSIAANNPVQPAGGGSGSVAVTPSASGCSWIASTTAPWLTPSPPSGTGNGNVTFTAALNGGAAARSGVIQVAGQSITVNQNGLTCSYSLLSPSANIPSAGGPGSVGVSAAGGCAWSATSPVPWVQITGGTPGSGAGTVNYTVLQNTTGLDRSTNLTIAGVNFPVTQVAAACVIGLGSSSFSAGEFAVGSSFPYTTSVSSCAHTVQSFSSWINVTSNPYAGTNGSVNFDVAANTFGAVRSGTIHVGDQVFIVTQAASTCAYVLTGGYAAMFGRLGSPNNPLPVSVQTMCGPPAVVVNGPPGMITLGSVLSPAPGMFTQNYDVSLYQTFINFVRTAQLLIQGQIFTVKQNSF